MRKAFANQLIELEQRVASELEAAIRTLGEIAAAIADPTSERLEAIAGAGRTLRRSSRAIHRDLVRALARQGPVASDLRLVLVLMELARTERLIANQFEKISDDLAAINADVPDRLGTTEQVSEMAALAAAQLQHAATAFSSRDLVLARQLDQEDDAIDGLNLTVFETAVAMEAGREHRELGLRHVLIARSLERIGDNAVDIGEQAAFLLTTELREFTDASRPRPIHAAGPRLPRAGASAARGLA